jgi:hypothetical protein
MFKIELYEEAADAYDKLATRLPAAPYEFRKQGPNNGGFAKERAESQRKNAG